MWFLFGFFIGFFIGFAIGVLAMVALAYVSLTQEEMWRALADSVAKLLIKYENWRFGKDK
jgi:predicted small integral membrane protein